MHMKWNGRAILAQVLLVAAASWCAPAWGAQSPAAVEITLFRPEKVIYKPGEMVDFSVAFSTTGAMALAMQLWIERELDAPFKVAEVPLKSTPGRQTAKLSWLADKNVFGHRAFARLVDSQATVLAQADTTFDVASDWQHVMRLASIGVNGIARASFTDARMQETIQRMRDAHFNTLQAWTFAPRPYELAPAADAWPFQYGKPGEPPILKERLQAWGKALHAQGFKFIGYDETAAISGPPEWQLFSRPGGTQKPIAPYFADRGMFTPNSLRAAPRFAEQLAESVRMFGWDGILLDSAINAHINTSESFDSNGNKITDLAPGEIGYQHLAGARKQAQTANPDFRFFAQNATSVSRIAVKEAPSRIYQAVGRNAERLKIREYSKVVDLYTAEIDPHHEPRDGRYPLTYETMSVSLNSLVEMLGKPLMAWAFLVKPGTEDSIAFIRPYFALHLASRTHVHDHFTFYGGAGSSARSPAVQQFIRYNAFLARYSYYLHDPELRWLTNANDRFAINSSKPLFWDRTVYRKSMRDGGERVVINVLNLPSNGRILGQTEIPQPVENLTLTLKDSTQPQRVVWLNADDASLKPAVVQGSKNAAGYTEYRLPAVIAWGVVVIETSK